MQTFGPRFRWRCIFGIHTWVYTAGPSRYAQACRYCYQPRTRR